VRTLARLDRAEIERLLVRDEFFWLDLDSPSDDELDGLSAVLGWDPLALEDAKEFGQRPKLDDYANHALLVFYGVHTPDGTLVEVHLFVSGGWIVTIHRAPCQHLHMQRDALADSPPHTEEAVVYRILDALTDSFQPCLDAFEEEIEGLEDEIVAAPHERQVSDVLRLRRRIGPMRRAASAQRDLFASVGDVVDRLPGLERDTAGNQFRDVADHLHRTAEVLESQRDRLAGALQIYSSMSDNRLNRVTERLTLVATVFLPLTWTVGFFGQNFGWLVRHVDGPGSFLIWGIGVSFLLPLVAIYLLFIKAGYLKRPVVSPALLKQPDED
jgi:magnesium transporter